MPKPKKSMTQARTFSWMDKCNKAPVLATEQLQWRSSLEQLQLEKIERILKPSTADRNLYKQLSNKTAEAAKDCGEIRKNIVEENDRTIGQFNKLMNAYDRCMNEAKMKEQKSFALRDEIRSKRGSWMQFTYVRTQSAEHMQTYWTDARVNYKLLEESLINSQFNKDTPTLKHCLVF
ncbi:hypothetical protein D918_10107 [Trichuris suis]|nr:hypothetical protein D918_10107 [Trichuris suis]